MPYLVLSDETNYGKKIMIFVEGTIWKPKSILFQYSYRHYVPVGKSVERIANWYSQGAEIFYCTYQRDEQKIADTARMLREFGYPGSRLYYRLPGQNYREIVETIVPDILIEDDCYSIGGAKEMCVTNLAAAMKDHIQSIVVKEFHGIDALSPNYLEL